MPADKPSRKETAKKRRLAETIETLIALHFGPRQRNETAAYTLLALLDLQPTMTWAEAQAPLRGITPIIDFIATAYEVRYAPNTRETIRDEAVKFFVEAGLLLRNPDDPKRPTGTQYIRLNRLPLLSFERLEPSNGCPACRGTSAVAKASNMKSPGSETWPACP